MSELLTAKELIDQGYLQEANRRFFHPLGLALHVKSAISGTDMICKVTDDREDPEGVYYNYDKLIAPDKEIMRERYENVEKEIKAKKPIRKSLLGFIMEPIYRIF